MTISSSGIIPRRSLAALASFFLLLSACGSSTSDAGASNETSGADLAADAVSAEEGAASRQAQASALGAAVGAGADGKELASDMAIDCGIDVEEYEPTAEEIATSNADTDALADALEAAGIATTRTTDVYGFTILEWDYENSAAQEVADAFWTERYPPEPLPAEEIARIKAENEAIAAALDAVGASYTLGEDALGAEWLQWDYENPEAAEAVAAVYAKLYPSIPPTEEELAESHRQADELAAAFEATGITFTRVSDELGWEWLEWDYEDPEAVAAVEKVFAELYPIDPTIDPCALAE
ncbi:MAG: hypothetical protein O3C27_16755 [Actinomycetota bacterium]|nr:hypothetical protein [Actinomycetota bacterium]